MGRALQTVLIHAANCRLRRNRVINSYKSTNEPINQIQNEGYYILINLKILTAFKLTI